MDGRRHSVDIPISRTLIALRRVRSLRDPSTNSMSKFSSLFDNVKWETNSSNGISLQFVNGCTETGSELKELRGPEYYGFNERREEQGYDFGLHSVPEDSNSKLIICENAAKVGNRAGKAGELDDCNGDSSNYGVNKEEVQKYSPLDERYDSNFNVKGMSLICMAPSCNSMEDLASCNEPVIGSLPAERINTCDLKPKCQSRNQVKSYGANGDAASPSIDAISNYSTSLHVDENVDTADLSHRGCGISYCWSKTPRLRESNPSSDFEDFPLLSSDTGEITLCGQSFWKCINGEINPYSDTPRSLGQKFKPKSFDELVGQSVVVRSLLNAITKGRVASFYLFYGPRGTGKTCASRIFAAALNCLSLEEHKPCGRCRECIMFFSGRIRDVKEIDSLRVNRSDRLRSLVKNAVALPVSSRFKIFIIDECQLLHGETWATVLNSLEKLSQHVVFIMSTPELDMLPRSVVSRAQKYHFPKIKDSDISNRLEKICFEERLDYDQAALGFIAAKSNGSLRDAEMMLDQLSLLGKRITKSLTYELIGTVSDDELLDLLDLALSCDTSNTVIRAREIMRSKIDPMQLISQLANLIMDILAGKCEEGSSEARKFFEKHTSESSLQKLSHALRVLSETEKHLRVSKNQTTWLTVALLQLSSMESNFMNANDSKLCFPNAQHKDSDSNSTSSTVERSNHPFTCMCNGINSSKLGKRDGSERSLESIWNKATELCQSGSLKKFLRKQGKLSSLQFNQGLAIAELEFCHPNHVSRAEKSWKHIASSLQLIVGSNVEIRINLLVPDQLSKGKVRKPSFSLFSCSRRLRLKSSSSTKSGSDSEVSQYASEKPMISNRQRPILTCHSDHGFEIPRNSSHGLEVVRAFRNSEGNILSTGATPSCGSIRDDMFQTPAYINDSSKGEGRDCGCQNHSVQEPDYQPNCFPRTLRSQKKVHLSNTAKTISTTNQEENKLALSIPGVCSNDPYVLYSSDNEDRLRENSEVLCWRTPTIPLKKAWQLTYNRRSRRLLHIADWVLPCSIAQ
ncbi:protein STICHEL-like 2 isoform X1 [Hibiscus syriacus]|uniref:protein STICHEL-like 2 isoform X1 n=1 Tax=Hibiscus syriacus TaxID=106335 RepID=UPI001923D5EB|nr:protein STICHEL-like 2 isoform X1 [Hibiscus syriacus]XP_039020179.1 protein STICHEL-like 2 isoform X1 [Hibiscus syriacus]